MPPAVTEFLTTIWRALGGEAKSGARVEFTGDGALPSVFAVTDLAAASIGAAALAVADYADAGAAMAPAVRVDRRLASFWFGFSLKPIAWSLPPAWDAIAGDYACADGWIKLHTNAAHHRQAALAVLATAGDKEAARAAVKSWRADELEAAFVARRGCAATMRSMADWSRHPQGKAVASEPLVWLERTETSAASVDAGDRARPLAGVRVLDLTRILAGPIATRFLAGFGAEVLRIDPPNWEEPTIAPEVTLGKRCARLDLSGGEGRERFLALLSQADVIIHGYRPDALERLGLGAAMRRSARPGLIDVSLDAYGWTGPWTGRRGFDSLVQMSSGIADEGMRRAGADIPKPLPVQALDHATGYLMAAAAVRGLSARRASGKGSLARVSLARTAALLTSVAAPPDAPALTKPDDGDYGASAEATAWGPARRLRPPVTVEGAPMRWDIPAGAMGSSPPRW
jgi:CoA-transferase family III